MASNQKKRVALTMPKDLLDEANREAKRQGRSVSQLFEIAWSLHREEILKMPAFSSFSDVKKQ